MSKHTRDDEYESDLDAMSDIEENINNEEDSLTILHRLTRDATNITKVTQRCVANAKYSDLDDENHSMEDGAAIDRHHQLRQILDDEHLLINEEDRESLHLSIDHALNHPESDLNQISISDFRRFLHTGISTAVEQSLWNSILENSRAARVEQINMANTNAEMDDDEAEDEFYEDRAGMVNWAMDMIDQLKEYHGNEFRLDFDRVLQTFSTSDREAIRQYSIWYQTTPVEEWLNDLTNVDRVIPDDQKYAEGLLLDAILEDLDQECEAHEEKLNQTSNIRFFVDKLEDALRKFIKRLTLSSDEDKKDLVEETENECNAASSSNAPSLSLGASIAAARARVVECLERELKMIDAWNVNVDDRWILEGAQWTILEGTHQKITQVLQEEEDLPVADLAIWYEELRDFAARHEWFSETILPKKNFRLLVEEIGQQYKNDLKLSDEAFDAIQVAAEGFLTEQFDMTGGQLALLTNDADTSTDPIAAPTRTSAPIEQFVRPSISMGNIFRTDLREYQPVPVHEKSLYRNRNLSSTQPQPQSNWQTFATHHPQLFRMEPREDGNVVADSANAASSNSETMVE